MAAPEVARIACKEKIPSFFSYWSMRRPEIRPLVSAEACLGGIGLLRRRRRLERARLRERLIASFARLCLLFLSACILFSSLSFGFVVGMGMII